MRLLNRIVNKVSRYFKWYHEFWGYVDKFWTLNTFNIECVNLGGTESMYAFSYGAQSLSAKNWAVPSQTLFYDFNVLKNYFSYLKKGAHVIECISLSSFQGKIISKRDNLKYYTFLHPATIYDFDEHEREVSLKTRINFFKQKPILYLWNCLTEIFTTPTKWIFKNKKQRKALTKFLCNTKTIDISEYNDILAQMKIFCEERNLHLTIVVPPLHKSIDERFKIQYIENFIQPIKNELKKLDIKCLDFIDSQLFNDDNYFRSYTCLNEKGAQKFTEQVLKAIYI